MSGNVAEVLLNLGFEVSGSNVKASPRLPIGWP